MSDTVIMKNVRPFYGRATVQESQVEEEQLASGLVVPFKSDGSPFKRGVVLEVSHDPPHLGADSLEAGMVVYYRHGVKIGDVTVVELSDVLAYES